MKTEQKERSVLEQALLALKQKGINVAIQSYGGPYDARIRVDVHGTKVVLDAAIKRQISRPELGAILAQLNTSPKPVLITRYVSDRLGDDLRTHAIDYIDTVGNASLQSKGLHVMISGERLRDRGSAVPARAFRPAGLRLIFAILSVPDLLNATYREMAKAAPVALGGVPSILQSLTEAGYLKELEGRRRLLDAHELANEWARAYARSIWSRDVLGRFDLPTSSTRSRLKLPEDVFWGGEAAAAIRTHHLKPEIYTLYAKDLPKDLIVRSRFRRDEGGRYEFRKRFWAFRHSFDQHGLTPPLLIWADLLAIGESRTIETARMFYENEIARSLDEL